MYYLFYKVNKSDIYKIKFILEAYENMMSVSTIDETICKLQITVAPDFLEDARGILKNLQTEMFMEELDEDHTKSQGRY